MVECYQSVKKWDAGNGGHWRTFIAVYEDSFVMVVFCLFVY